MPNNEVKPRTRVKVSKTKDKSRKNKSKSETVKVVTKVKIAQLRRSKSILNGSHGEYTGDDDMPKKQKVGKKVKRAAKRVAKKVRKVASDSVQLTVCAAKYAIAIADPWDRNAMGACVPSFPSRPSMKTHGYIRGTVTIGGDPDTMGYGWIVISPCLANNSPTLHYTTSSYGGSPTMRSYDPTSGALYTGVVTASCSNLPFTKVDLDYDVNSSSAVQGRIVSASCSVRYTGTELNRGGSVYCYASSDHTNIANLSVNDLGSYSETEISSPGANRNKCAISVFGVNDDELRYGYVHPSFETAAHNLITSCYPFSDLSTLQTSASAGNACGAAPMVIGLSGVAGTTYFFEYIVHVEYIGKLAQSMLTPNTVDFDGLAIVQTAASNLFSAKMSNPMTPMPVLMKRELQDAMKTYGPALKRTGAALIKSSFR